MTSTDRTPLATDNYYHLLNVPYTANKAEITVAYRTIMKRWHPDRVAEYKRAHAEDLAKRVNQAYAVLTDPVRREQYDRSIRNEALQAQIMNRYVGGTGADLFVSPASVPRREITERELREKRTHDRQVMTSVLLTFSILALGAIAIAILYGLLGSLAAALW